MRLTRGFTCLLAVLFLAFGLAGCQEDPTGPVSKQKDEVTGAVKLQTADKALKNQPADKDQYEQDAIREKQDGKKKDSPKTTLGSGASTNDSSQSERPTENDEKNTNHEKADSGQNESGGTTSTSQNTESGNQETNTEPSEPAETVTLSIIGYKKTVIGSTKVAISEDDSFLDATLKILKEKDIPYYVRGSGSTAYVVSIDNFEEFGHGPYSGWIAKKNGQSLKQSAGITPVDDGDVIKWVYTTNYRKN